MLIVIYINISGSRTLFKIYNKFAVKLLRISPGSSEGFHLSDEELWNIYGSRGQNDLLSNENTQVKSFVEEDMDF